MLRAIKSVIHVLVAAVAFFTAYEVVYLYPPEWWLVPGNLLSVLPLVATYAAIAGVIEAMVGVEAMSWRFVSMRDALLLARSATLTALGFLALTFVVARAEGLPRSTLLLAWFLQLGGLLAPRIIWRARYDGSILKTLFVLRPRFHAGHKDTPLLIVGEASRADAFLRDLEREPSLTFAPVGIVSLSPKDTHHNIRAVPILGGAENLDSVVRRLRRRGVAPKAILFLCELSQLTDVTPDQIGRLRSSGMKLLRLPAVTEVSDLSKVSVREISLEELLPRPPVLFDEALVRGFISGRRVLVTGAGGSIGSELCRQIAAMGASHLTLLDFSESGLFSIAHELRTRIPSPSLSEVLCDIRDPARLSYWVQRESPEIVFHAAALKHVPMMEKHPCEAVKTNIQGTRNVIDAAEAAKVSHFVMISTDKAVDPSSVMGATKRVAETLTRRRPRDSRVRYSVVRFGNVLGSSGSVVPIFQAQIERGGPVTVTHRDVERFFMTIPEAVQLVLYTSSTAAGQAGNGGRLFVLEMGRPVRIIDLARRMIELSGKRPDIDIEIEVVGLRDGEKITEELVDTGEISAKVNDNVMEVINNADGHFSEARIDELERIAMRGEEDGVRKQLFEVIRLLRCFDVVDDDVAASRVAGQA